MCCVPVQWQCQWQDAGETIEGGGTRRACQWQGREVKRGEKRRKREEKGVGVKRTVRSIGSGRQRDEKG
eukprot:5650105-Prorocentrum_lima.AAC.1